jgi:hypothetical protein
MKKKKFLNQSRILFMRFFCGLERFIEMGEVGDGLV